MRYISPIIITTITSFLLLLSCEPEELSRPFGKVRTLAITEIDSTGVTFHGETVAPANAENLEKGFIWYNVPRSVIPGTPEEMLNYRVATKQEGNQFSARLEVGLDAGYQYFVRAYLRSAEWVVYGEEMAFTSVGSLAPIIESIAENALMPGDTMTLRGKYFELIQERGRVTIGTETTKVVSYTSTEIKCIVPLNTFKGQSIVVQSGGGPSSAPFPMPEILAPQIQSFSPSTLTIGDTLTLQGRFSTVFSWNRIEGAETTVVSADGDRIQLVINGFSPNSRTAYVQVKVGLQSSNSITFDITQPIITDFFPKEGSLGDTITITGDYFIPGSAYNGVVFGNFNNFEVIETTKKTIKAIVTRISNGGNTSLSEPLNVVMAGYWISTSQPFRYVVRDWKAVASFPGQFQYENLLVGFTLQNKLYFNNGYSTDWWTYEVAQNTWRKASTMPRPTNTFPTNELAVTIGESAYVLQREAGSPDLLLWRYDAPSGQWTSLPGLPYPAGVRYFDDPPVAFAIEGKLQVCFGSKDQPCWTFNPLTEQWSPFKSYLSNITPDLYQNPTVVTAAAYGQKGYLLGRTLFSEFALEYDALSDQWKSLSTLPSEIGLRRKSAFVLNNKVIFLGVNRAVEWDPNRQQIRYWSIDFPPIQADLSNIHALVLENQAFVAIGGQLFQWFPR